MILCFYIDEKTKEILDELSKKGDSKSKVIRNAIQFYEEFYFGEEIQTIIDSISKKTRLTRKQVVEEAIKVFHKVIS